MDNSQDLARADELLQFKMRMLQAEIEMQGMIAENKQREICGNSMAYTYNQFIELINQHRIGFNDYPYYCGR